MAYDDWAIIQQRLDRERREAQARAQQQADIAAQAASDAYAAQLAANQAEATRQAGIARQAAYGANIAARNAAEAGRRASLSPEERANEDAKWASFCERLAEYDSGILRKYQAQYEQAVRQLDLDLDSEHRIALEAFRTHLNGLRQSALQVESEHVEFRTQVAQAYLRFYEDLLVPFSHECARIDGKTPRLQVERTLSSLRILLDHKRHAVAGIKDFGGISLSQISLGELYREQLADLKRIFGRGNFDQRFVVGVIPVAQDQNETGQAFSWASIRRNGKPIRITDAPKFIPTFHSHIDGVPDFKVSGMRDALAGEYDRIRGLYTSIYRSFKDHSVAPDGQFDLDTKTALKRKTYPEAVPPAKNTKVYGDFRPEDIWFVGNELYVRQQFVERNMPPNSWGRVVPGPNPEPNTMAWHTSNRRDMPVYNDGYPSPQFPPGTGRVI